MPEECLQERFAPHNGCFGCGTANNQGLRLRSFPDGEGLIAQWRPEAHHQAFPGVLCGGIIGSLLDCHCNWTACHHLMIQSGADKPPCTVTSEYTIRLHRPTPMDQLLTLRSRVVKVEGGRVVVEAEIRAGDRLCDSCEGTFIAVEPGHPAYHGW